MKLALVVCIYNRHDLEVISLDNFKRQSKKYGFDVIVVGSEGDVSRSLAEGCIYVEHLNNPVSDKHNAGFAKAREIGCDGVVLMGSDDFVSDNYFDFVKSNFDSENVLGLKDLYFYSTKTKGLSYFKGYANNSQTVGAGRFFPASVLNKMDWKLWSSGLNKGLDTNCSQRLAKKGIAEHSFSMEETGIFLVDVKHSRSITNHSITQLGEEKHIEIMEKRLPKKTVSKVKGLEAIEEKPIELDDSKSYLVRSNGKSKFLKEGVEFVENSWNTRVLLEKGFVQIVKQF